MFNILKFCVKNNIRCNRPHARTHFPWLFLFSMTFPRPLLNFPTFPGFPGERRPRITVSSSRSLLTDEAVKFPPVRIFRRSFSRRTCEWHAGRRRRAAAADLWQPCGRNLSSRPLTCGISRHSAHWCRGAAANKYETHFKHSFMLFIDLRYTHNLCTNINLHLGKLLFTDMFSCCTGRLHILTVKKVCCDGPKTYHKINLMTMSVNQANDWLIDSSKPVLFAIMSYLTVHRTWQYVMMFDWSRSTSSLVHCPRFHWCPGVTNTLNQRDDSQFNICEQLNKLLSSVTESVSSLLTKHHHISHWHFHAIMPWNDEAVHKQRLK